MRNWDAWRFAQIRLLSLSALLTCLSLSSAVPQPAFADDTANDTSSAEDAAAEHSEVCPLTTLVPAIPAEIHLALQSRDFAAAVAAIDAALATPEAENVAFLLYLKGRSLTESGNTEAALAAYQQIVQEHPESDWASRARFGIADVYVRSRNYQLAAQIYQAEAGRLLSRERKDELAAIYLEFADLYFEGIPAADPSAEPLHDYGQALVYYQQALTLGPSLTVRQLIEFRIARCYVEIAQPQDAADAYQRFITSYGSDDTPETERADESVLTEARFRLGDVQLQLGLREDARRTWQDMIREQAAAAAVAVAVDDDVAAPESDEADEDFVIKAKYRIAHTFGFPNPSSTVDLELGVAAASEFIAAYPDHELAPQAELEIAQSFLHRGRQADGVARLGSLIANANYAESDVIPQARYLLGAALAGQGNAVEAIAAWKEFLEQHPTHPSWSEVQQQIINLEYYIAQQHMEREEFDEARVAWEAFLNKYPLDGRAPDILFAFGEMQHLQGKARNDAENEEVEFDPAGARRQFEAAIADWRKLISKFPNSASAAYASLRIGITLEEDLGQLPEALESYQQVLGNYVGEAQQRIARLTAHSLVVETERKFRSDEQPSIQVTVRNIDTVQVKVYRLDLTDYFRKMHLATGVESLDIALIDPDEQFERAIPDYEDYREIEHQIEIPLNEPGVCAVTVTGENMESTTMVVVSDLDIVVKSSRNELFVFAENMRTGEPVEGVSLLVSNGGEIFAENVTGADGVLQQSFEELKSASDLRVFAVFEGHVASTVTDLNGLEFAVGLTPRGYIDTDRPAYRPGQMVHVKGIVREVDQDRFTFTAGEIYHLAIYDARGRRLHESELALNDFGSIADHLLLPDTATLGNYRVVLQHRASGRAFETSFEVVHFQLEPVQLTVDLPQTVYHRGEVVEGTIKLAYYYGSPLAGKTIQYQLAQEGRSYTGVTDENGEVAFRFETTRFAESTPLQVYASFPERNLNVAETAYLATRGFEIGVSTLRDVYLDEEPFEATIEVNDPAGEPVATELTIEVLQRVTEHGRTAEKLVETFNVASDQDEGQVRQTISLAEGGEYVIRARGVDQFEQEISGEHVVNISDADDSVRLRILVDRNNYEVGDEGQIRLHWREDPALALVTFEGASILGYQLVELQTGENVLDVPMESHLAPNFQLSVVVMQRNQFHTAETQFRVSQRLEVAVTPSAAEAKPGEPVEVEVTVTDPQGNPVSAELSLGLVQTNLLDRYSPRQGDIASFFSTGNRSFSIRQSASCTFAYNPTTEGVNEFLLAEMERQATIERESAARGRAIANYDLDGAMAEQLDALAGAMPAMDAPAAPPVPGMEYNGMPESGEAALGMAGRPGGYGGGRGFGADESRHDQFGYYADDQLHSWSAIIESRTPPQATDLFFAPAGQSGGTTVLFTERWSDITRQSELTINGITEKGEFFALNNLDDDVLQQLAAEGVQVLPSLSDSETGFWNPMVVTDEAGKATVTVVMPTRSTAWTLEAKGIDAGSQAGEAETSLITRKELFTEPKLPTELYLGDTATVPVEVHSMLDGDHTATVTLKLTLGERTTELTQEATFTGPGIQDLQFSLTVPDAIPADDSGRASVEISVVSGDYSDVANRSINIRPFGAPVYATAAGESEQSTLTFVEFGGGLNPQSTSMEIQIGPTLNRALLDAVLGGYDILERCGIPSNPIERSISDVLGGSAVLTMIRNGRNADAPEVEALTNRIRSALNHLVSSQQDNGTWSWTGRGGEDRFLTSRAVWALIAARDAGFAVEPQVIELGKTALSNLFSQAAQDDRDGQAILLHGLAVADAADFAFANRLHRERNSMNVAGQLHLALALAELDRKEMGAEVLALVDLNTVLETANQLDQQVVAGAHPWMGSGIELRAMYLLALESINPTSTKAPELAAWLMAARVGSRWAVEKANGPAIAALADWYGRVQHVEERYTLTVYVNDIEVESLTVEPAQDSSRTITVPAELLAAGERQRVNFDLEGRGRFSYSIVMTGFVPAGQLADTTNQFRISRTYEPALREFEGQTVPRGFSIARGEYQSFRNSLTQLPVGERGEVQLRISRSNEAQQEYLIITEAIPGGCVVAEDSISGGYERYELTGSSITFYMPPRSSGDIRYTLVGYVPGDYQVLPTICRSFYNMQQLAVAGGNAPRQLAVLGLGEESPDEYRLSPDELYHFGQRYLAAGDFESAHTHLTQLVDGWELEGNVYRDVVTMLFRTSLLKESQGEIVRYFEIVKERYPDFEMTFEQILQVASAYLDLGEYERSYLVYRATIEGSFERENQVAGFLEQRGELLRSIQVVEDILRDYPAEGYVAQATYALAQEVYRKAPGAAQDAKLVQAGITRVDLITSAVTLLDHFLTVWPKDPAADQASFALANALLDLEEYQAAITRCERYGELYPESLLLDSFWYIIGYSQFQLGNHEAALEICRKVAETKFGEGAGERDAANKWEAVYIMGQIYHSIGQAAEAIAEYSRVNDRFPDAREAIYYFERQAISLPEVTTITPDGAREVPLSFRNIAEVSLKVYRIDLLKFSLMQRNLDQVTAINLAGIHPYHEETIALGDGKDYADREHVLELPLEELGAYLVVCRGDNLYATGLVVVTPLVLDVREDAQSGRVRVTVQEAGTDAYLDDVHVKVIGSGNSNFTTGETDLRGLFVADDIRGESTVIATLGEGEYAFFRGELPLQGFVDPGQVILEQAPTEGESLMEDKDALRMNLMQQNSIFQQEQQMNYEGLINNDRSGVAPSEAF